MTIDFDAIEAQITTDIGEGIAGGVNDSLKAIAVPATTLAATYTWAGTTVVLASDTSEVQVGNSIRLDSDGNWFRVASITENVSVIVVSDYGATIPIGASQSSFTDVSLPAPADPSSVEDSLGAAIASAVRTALETFASDAVISGVTSGIEVVGPGVIS